MMYIQIHFILRLKLRILPDAHNGPQTLAEHTLSIDTVIAF